MSTMGIMSSAGRSNSSDPGTESTLEALGDMVRFIAFPDFRGEDRAKAFKEGFLADIQSFHDNFGARIVKLWNAPRLRELITGDAAKDLVEFDAPWRIRAAELAQSL